MTVYMTARLIARAFHTRDAVAAFAMWSDPQILAHTGDEAPSDIGVIEADIIRWQTVAERGPGCGFWAITSHNAEFLGDIYIRPLTGHPGEYEIGWHLARPYWGHGYATEAAIGAIAYAQSNAITQLVALTEPGHAASRRVAEKAGMTFACLTQKYSPAEPPVAAYTWCAATD